MKITSIKFFDYRAFFNGANDEYLINTENKNLFIYGENGSGKTSLFRGLKDFIHASDFVTHNQTTRVSEGFIEITLDDGFTDRFDETGLKPTKKEILQTLKLNSFLSYKELLKTYLFEFTDQEPNLFDLIVNAILKDHTLDTLGNLNDAWKEIKSKNIREEIVLLNIDLGRGKITEEEHQEQKDLLNDNLKNDFKLFEDELKQLLVDINIELTRVIKYFDKNIELQLELMPINIGTPDKSIIKSNVKFYNKAINNYHDFLNEARLSAISLSIYLAAIKSNPTDESLKLLVLDDVFIGLDMSNRIPLLDILNIEFKEWQIFLTTYDRHWFEVGKKLLSSDWKHIEMYSGKKDAQAFEHPIILLESDDHFVKAKKYYNAKDYPASGNYLRKEIEKIIKDRLPEEKIRVYGERPHALSHLWSLFIERYKAIGGQYINAEITTLFQTSRITLLNPLSHDNINTPIYEYELKKAFHLVELLKQIPIINGILIADKGSEFTFTHPKENYKFIFELTSAWRLEIENDIVTEIQPNCMIKHWEFNKEFFWNFKNNSRHSEDEIKKIKEKKDVQLEIMIENITIKNKALKITKEDFLAGTTCNSWQTLQEIYTKIDKTKNTNHNMAVMLWTKIKNLFDF